MFPYYLKCLGPDKQRQYVLSTRYLVNKIGLEQSLKKAIDLPRRCTFSYGISRVIKRTSRLYDRRRYLSVLINNYDLFQVIAHIES